jgi:hypothetical protein
LSVCAPPVSNEDQGNLKIILSPGNGARAINPGVLMNLVYEINFSGPAGERRRVVTEPGIGQVSVFLPSGDWTVRADCARRAAPAHLVPGV